MKKNDKSICLKTKAIPGATKEKVEIFGEYLKIKVNAAPEKGQANTAILRLLAVYLNLPASSIRITRGHSSTQKTINVSLTTHKLAELIQQGLLPLFT